MLFCAAALWLTGCFKNVGYDTDIRLKSWMQAESSANLEGMSGVVAYAFEADTLTWTIASYEDALNGVLTRKESGERGVAPVAGELILVDSVATEVLSMQVSSTPVILVAVDTENRLYGYRQQDLGENLSPLYTSVIFRPWKLMKKYVDGSWRMFNDFYVDEPDDSGGGAGDETGDEAGDETGDGTDDEAGDETAGGAEDETGKDAAGDSGGSDNGTLRR